MLFLHKIIPPTLCLMLMTCLQLFPSSHALATLVSEIPVS